MLEALGHGGGDNENLRTDARERRRDVGNCISKTAFSTPTSGSWSDTRDSLRQWRPAKWSGKNGSWLDAPTIPCQGARPEWRVSSRRRDRQWKGDQPHDGVKRCVPETRIGQRRRVVLEPDEFPTLRIGRVPWAEQPPSRKGWTTPPRRPLVGSPASVTGACGVHDSDPRSATASTATGVYLSHRLDERADVVSGRSGRSAITQPPDGSMSVGSTSRARSAFGAMGLRAGPDRLRVGRAQILEKLVVGVGSLEAQVNLATLMPEDDAVPAPLAEAS